MDFRLSFYQTPTDDLIRNRREFYGLCRESDVETGTWLNQVQTLIDRCEFPSILSREYLLIDKFVCELNANAREFIQSEGNWTLAKLKEYFFDQEFVSNGRVNVNITIDETFEHPSQQFPSPLPSAAIGGREFQNDNTLPQNTGNRYIEIGISYEAAAPVPESQLIQAAEFECVSSSFK